MAAGETHSLVLAADGSVWSWGANELRQLGHGLDLVHPVPMPVPSLGDVAAITAIRYESYALKADGTVWAWGSNGADKWGFTTPHPTGAVTPLSGYGVVKEIFLRESALLALKHEGSVIGCGLLGLGHMIPYPHQCLGVIPNLADYTISPSLAQSPTYAAGSVTVSVTSNPPGAPWAFY